MKWSKEDYEEFQRYHAGTDSINIDKVHDLSWPKIVEVIVSQCKSKGVDYIVAFNIYPGLIDRLGYPILGIIMDN